jgi:uncharacterized membrane protein
MNLIRRLLVLLPLLALVAWGGPAAPAHADELPPVSLTTSAHVDAYAAPGQSVTVPWFVENSGADPLLVALRPGEYTLPSVRYPAIAWVEPIAPSQLTLTSGQSATVQITVDVPAATAPGNWYVNIAASAEDAACTGTCNVGAIVAGTLEVHVSGS